MRKSLWLLAASLFGAAAATPALAQSTATTGNAAATSSAPTTKQPTTKQQSTPVRQMRASVLIGKDVRNAQGEDLGDIKDLVIDVNSGKVHYVVLSFGGFLGLGDKLFAYPARAFKPSADRDELILNVDKEKLKNAPGFDASKYPDWNAPAYRDQVNRHFGPDVAIAPTPNMRLVRASELLGKDVNDPAGRDLGEIRDVVVNMTDGDVRYVVLEFDQSWSLRDKLFAFQLKSFKQGAQWKDDLVLNVSKDALNNVPGFDKNHWPNVNDPKWVADVDRYLVATAVIPLPSAANDTLWNRLDRNHDGVLTQEEAKADPSVQADWKRMDADHDGRVTRSEFDTTYRK